MKFSRKKFLKSSTFTLSSLYLGASVAGVYSQPAKVVSKPSKGKKKTAIIIGGGVSGLYAAYLLQQSGYKITLVEASSRLGGRVFTVKDEVSGLTADLGGEFISVRHKETIHLCKLLSLKLEPVNISPELVLNSVPSPTPPKYSKTTLEVLEKLYGLYRDMTREQKHQLDELSIFNYLKYQGVPSDDLFFLDLHFSSITGKELKLMSAGRGITALNHFLKTAGSYFRIKNGTYSLIDALEANLKSANIVLKDPVKSIDQETKLVKVTTESGMSFDGDICVCSIPGNLLDTIQWSPILPKEKKVASLKVNYSKVSKMVSFWDDCLWLRDNFFAVTNSCFRLLYVSGEDIQKKRGLLSGVSLGQQSEIFHKENSDFSKKIIELSLQNYDIFKQSKFSGLLFKAWHHEPFCSGGNSIYYPGTYTALLHLKEPFERVYFAGEHLSLESGSINSGLQSARDVVEMLESK
jgi:monoamine oxidase